MAPGEHGDRDPFDTTSGTLKLNNHLCFALYEATRAVTRMYREALSPFGLTFPQYLTLVVLWERDGLTVTEIGQRLALDSGTLTPLLKRLEADGLVERRRRDTDEREVEVSLTAKGSSLRHEMHGLRARVLARLAMPEPEIGQLRAQLKDLSARLVA